jgi:hypothetical protein
MPGRKENMGKRMLEKADRLVIAIWLSWAILGMWVGIAAAVLGLVRGSGLPLTVVLFLTFGWLPLCAVTVRLEMAREAALTGAQAAGASSRAPDAAPWAGTDARRRRETATQRSGA